MADGIKPASVDRKNGGEPFHRDGESIGFDVQEFWSWSASDLVANTTRGLIAEFLVTKALGKGDSPRAEWDAFDVSTNSGLRVEVKSGAYLQSWEQRSLSEIRFSIKPTQGWDASSNTISEERKRQADVYVFCVLHHLDPETLDPLNLTQWSFYVLSTKQLNAKLGEQKTVGLSRLRNIGARQATYNGLNDAIRSAVLED